MLNRDRIFGNDSYADFSQLRAQNQAFEEMYATSPLEITVREPLPRKLKGVLALIMTCIGLYGVVAFVVVQRTREIGIRIALGAPPLSVLRTVVTGSMLRVTLGIALGIPLCIVASKIVASVFFAIKPFDPAAYVTTPLFLASVTLAAAYVPARRATRIDPMTALRREYR